MNINIMIEPTYVESIWCKQTLAGINDEINKKRYTINILDGAKYESINYAKLFKAKEKSIMLIGTSLSWIPKATAFFKNKGISVFVVSCTMPKDYSDTSYITIDYRSATTNLLKSLSDAKKDKTALVGINPDSSSDAIKTETFLSYKSNAHNIYSPNNVYYNCGSVEKCYNDFFSDIKKYNSIICANDVISVYFAERLIECGISIPDDCYIISFGGSLIARMHEPSITSIVLDFFSCGKQALLHYIMLLRNPIIARLNIFLSSEIIVGKSTPGFLLEPEMPENTDPNRNTTYFYADDDVKEILAVEHFLDICDKLDYQIILGLLENMSYSKLADITFSVESTIKYRIKKMIAINNVSTRDELVSKLMQYVNINSVKEHLLFLESGKN